MPYLILSKTIWIQEIKFYYQIGCGEHIKIDGYTDFIGTEAYNLDLSVKRARAIKDFLISKGAIGSNISIEGYGEQNPADTNQTAAGRSRNRRVEFIISRG